MATITKQEMAKLDILIKLNGLEYEDLKKVEVYADIIKSETHSNLLKREIFENSYSNRMPFV